MRSDDQKSNTTEGRKAGQRDGRTDVLTNGQTDEQNFMLGTCDLRDTWSDFWGICGNCRAGCGFRAASRPVCRKLSP